jgi:hypothetical protein
MDLPRFAPPDLASQFSRRTRAAFYLNAKNIDEAA